MSKITAKLHEMLHELATRFEEVRHPAAAELRAIHTRLDAVAADGEADARKVEADAVHAEAPVVTEAEQDAEHLAAEATATATEPAPVQPPAATTG